MCKSFQYAFYTSCTSMCFDIFNSSHADETNCVHLDIIVEFINFTNKLAEYPLDYGCSRLPQLAHAALVFKISWALELGRLFCMRHNAVTMAILLLQVAIIAEKLEFTFGSTHFGCMVVQRVERWTCDQQIVGSNPTWAKSCVTTLGKLFTRHTDVSVTKQYNLVPAKGRWCFAAGKVTAGLVESNGSLLTGGWLIVTCGLTACIHLDQLWAQCYNEYGTPLPFSTHFTLLYSE